METLIKILTLIIFILIAISIGLLISNITFCILGKAIMITYCIVAIILAIILAIGLDEGDF